MTIYFNMLSPFMEYRIRNNMKGNLVVTPEFSRAGVSMSTSIKS